VRFDAIGKTFAGVMAFKSAGDSIASGVAVIHQELHLVPELSVAENLFLAHLPCCNWPCHATRRTDRMR
jgi:ABC-type sugar transport system ATPase subunit